MALAIHTRANTDCDDINFIETDRKHDEVRIMTYNGSEMRMSPRDARLLADELVQIASDIDLDLLTR